MSGTNVVSIDLRKHRFEKSVWNTNYILVYILKKLYYNE